MGNKPAIAELGPRPELRWIGLDRLEIDQNYQRPIGDRGKKHIRRIATTFDWRLFEPLIVARREGDAERYAILNGQHRFEACRLRGDIDAIPCLVVLAPTTKEQAMAFMAVNRNRLAMTRLQVFWAALAGEDVTAVRIKRLCDQAGVKIGRSPVPVLPPCTTVATTAIEKVLVYGDKEVRTGLSLLVEAKGDEEDAFRSCLIVSVIRLSVVAGEKLDRDRFVRMLRRTDIEDLLHRSAMHRRQNGGSLEAACQVKLLELYQRAR